MRPIDESRAEEAQALPGGRSRTGLPTILVGAVFLRLLSIVVVQSYKHPVTWEFGEQARTLYAGYGYTSLEPVGVRFPSAHMPPLYPYLLCVVWKYLGQSPSAYLALEVLQAALGVLLVYFIYRLSAVVASRKVALTAAGLTAVWPSFIYLCNEFHSISVSILLAVAAVYYLVHFIEVSRAWRDAVGFGLCMGCLFLCRAEAVVLLPCYGLMLVWRCGRKQIFQYASGCLLALACLLPWTIRNYKTLGHIVLVSTSGGFNLWVGHNAAATGNSDYDLNSMPGDEKTLLKGVTWARDREVRRDQLFGRFAIDYMMSHPRQELLLALRKAFYFVVFDPTHKKGRQIGYWLPSLLLTLLGGYGMYLERDRLLKVYLPLTLSVLFSLVLAVALFSLPRYRIVIDPFLIIFAACALCRLVEVFSTRQVNRLKVGGHPPPGDKGGASL